MRFWKKLTDGHSKPKPVGPNNLQPVETLSVQNSTASTKLPSGPDEVSWFSRANSAAAGQIQVTSAVANAPTVVPSQQKHSPPPEPVAATPPPSPMPNLAATWFTDPTRRHGPHSPTDFNLHRIQRYGLNEWVQLVSTEPQRVQCTEVKISALDHAIQNLFEAIKDKHGLDSHQAVELFDQYLAGACPSCFHGVSGKGLQMAAAGSQMTMVLVGGGESFGRLLSGRCPNCESETLFAVWHGDKSYPAVESSLAISRAASTPNASERSRTNSVPQMGEQNRRTIYSEHKELTRSFIRKHAMMGLPQQTAIECALEDAANQVERTYGITFEQFLSIHKEGGAKKW
jgi:hypothetical protein